MNISHSLGGTVNSHIAIATLVWLREGHRRWLASVRVLADDTELDRERFTNWGEHLPTRVIIRIMIALLCW